MKHSIKIGFVIMLCYFLLSCNSNSYLFGFKSTDNTVDNIQEIETNYSISLPIVSFIFDPWSDRVLDELDKIPGTLGINRIYHITVSPNSLSSKEVADGLFDKQYTAFFDNIKKNNLRVVFRTMHEMNGGRYSRASNPADFKKAWIHVRELSRASGLSKENILFDMSVNHRDMPTKGVPSQTAKLIQCKLSQKAKLGCFTFEDYYPGDKYVDLMGFTFYNRGKGNSDRLWLSPQQIVNEKGREPLNRIKKFKKPIIIDEVGTTAVWYTGDYNLKLSREIYQKDYKAKNTWLSQLKKLLMENEDIVGVVYFNVDYTKGLSYRLIGEADWAVINPETQKVYNSVFSIIKDNEKFHQWTRLSNLFGIGLVKINNISNFIPIKSIKSTKETWKIINSKAKTKSEKWQMLDQLSGNNKYLELFIRK